MQCVHMSNHHSLLVSDVGKTLEAADAVLFWWNGF